MGQRRDVVPAQQNPARRRCQGAVEQPGDGRLARSAGADERYPLAGFDGEAEIRQRIARGVRIARADVVDDDPVATAQQIGGPGPVDDLGFVEEFTDALDAGARGEQGGQQVAEITDRAIAASEQGEEGQHPAEGQSVGGQRPYPEADHGEDTDEFEQVDQRQEERPHPAAGQFRTHDRAILPVVVGHGLAHHAVALHERGVSQAFLGDRTERAGPSSPFTRHRFGEISEMPCGPPEERDHHQGCQRELPLHPEQRHEVHHKGAHLPDAAGELTDHERFDGRDIGGETTQNVPRRCRSRRCGARASTWAKVSRRSPVRNVWDTQVPR